MLQPFWLWLGAFVLILFAAGCGCRDDDDDSSAADDDNADDDSADDDSAADDDTSDDDTGDDDTTEWMHPTAWDDFLAAEEQVRLANFSTAMTDYDNCLLKLADDEPLNDGPVPPGTRERADFGYVLTLTSLPLRILESFVSGWLAQADLTAMMENSLREIGVDPAQTPTSILTVYLLEIILPLLKQGAERLDEARNATDFVYRMPPIRFVFLNTPLEIPAVAGSDGLVEFDRADAHLFASIYHLIYSSSLVVTTQNLDTDAARIDDILQILMSGDLTQFFEMIQRYPNLLTLRDDDIVDGPAYMLTAHDEWRASFAALINEHGGHGAEMVPGESPDNFYDSWRLETDNQTDDFIGNVNGRVSLNMSVGGAEIGSGGVVALLNLAMPFLANLIAPEFGRALMGRWPGEANAANGWDDDYASGTSSALAATVLTDASAAFTPGAFVGDILTPNVARSPDARVGLTYRITSNTETTITVEAGDMREIASAGDTYAVGDGWIDDRPADLSAILRLLFGGFVPAGATVGLDIAAMYDAPFNIRDILPAWDADAGDPNFLGFVVDQTETYTDVNGNGRYDPGVDTFTDATHVFGDISHPADGVFEPYYFFFPDGALGGLLTYGGDFAGTDPCDNLNRIVSGLMSLIGGGAP